MGKARDGCNWTTAVQLLFSGGVMGSCWWSFDGPLGQRLTLVGEHGTLELDSPFRATGPATGRLEVAGRTEVLSLPSGDCYRREIEHFGAVIRGTAEPAVSLDDSARWLAVAETVDAQVRSSSRPERDEAAAPRQSRRVGAPMRWKVHGQQTLYQSAWVDVGLADVELPDGRHLDHHVLRMHRQSASAAVIDDKGRVLMLWRHRFTTDRWGWELPGGWVNPGEDPAEATRREVLEETGWEPGPLKLLCSYGADVGISDARFHLYQADGVIWQGPPADTTEATRVAWIPLSEVRELLDRGQVDDGASITALLYLLAFAPIGTAMKPGDTVPEAGAT